MTQQNIIYAFSEPNIQAAILNHFQKHLSDTFSRDNPEKQIANNLSNLHELFLKNNLKPGDPDQKDLLLKKGTDQKTLLHRSIYSSFDDENFLSSDFYRAYYQLCNTILETLKTSTGIKKEWAVQRFPTIRFHFPQNISVFEFHRDSDYGHPIGEINCFYAINECNETSALQVEKDLGLENYAPLNLQPGQYALLNTSTFRHGDKLNTSKATRVSMDFRFIPIENLGNTSGESLSTNKKFSVNDYFIKETDRTAPVRH